jgi:hypothetical protein
MGLAEDGFRVIRVFRGQSFRMLLVEADARTDK